jgi:hypothetical protein
MALLVSTHACRQGQQEVCLCQTGLLVLASTGTGATGIPCVSFWCVQQQGTVGGLMMFGNDLCHWWLRDLHA